MTVAIMLKELQNLGLSKEEAKDGSGTIKELVRFKNPNTTVRFVDLIRGEISFDTAELKDFIRQLNMNTSITNIFTRDWSS